MGPSPDQSRADFGARGPLRASDGAGRGRRSKTTALNFPFGILAPPSPLGFKLCTPQRAFSRRSIYSPDRCELFSAWVPG